MSWNTPKKQIVQDIRKRKNRNKGESWARKYWFYYPVMLVAVMTLVVITIYYYRAQSFDLNKINAMPERSIILDRLGVEIGRIHGEKRSLVELNQITKNFHKAIIAREDERFYSHGAVDIIGIARAIIKNIQGKKEGASTITQQLVSDVFELKKGEHRGETLKQLDRKLLEIAIAFRMESRFEKDEILQAYINQINWGRQIRGVSEASRIYFEKHPSELTLSESAMLAGIVRGPDAYNPFRSIELATRERNTTLQRMVEAEAITAEEAEVAKRQPLEVRPQKRRATHESYAMDAIRSDLELILEEENIQLGGLTIVTTIDSRMQKVAEEAVEKKLADIEKQKGFQHQKRTSWQQISQESRKNPEYLQASVVMIENKTGAVLVSVGGRDANESRFNRARDGYRQIGSLFKPFIYLSAFDKGLKATTKISDDPILKGEIKGAGTWKPQNSDGTFEGMQPVSYGLIRSRNTMSVRVGNYAGLDSVATIARMAGFSRDMPMNPASFLGAWEATPWEVASAYTVFPNYGKRYRPYLISEIKDRYGNVLYRTAPLSYSAAKQGSAWVTTQILQEVVNRGTASAIKRLGFNEPCAGKTGTTNESKDTWFSGFTSSVTCAVWVGLDTPKKIVQGAYGSTIALPIWVDVIKTADRLGYKAGSFDQRIELSQVRLCRLSGKRATQGCEQEQTAYTDEVPKDILGEINDFCPIHPIKALAVAEETNVQAASLSVETKENEGFQPSASVIPSAQMISEESLKGTSNEPIYKAIPIREDEDIALPMKAQRVEELEEDVPKAKPIKTFNSVLKALPVEEEVPRARAIEE